MFKNIKNSFNNRNLYNINNNININNKLNTINFFKNAVKLQVNQKFKTQSRLQIR